MPKFSNPFQGLSKMASSIQMPTKAVTPSAPMPQPAPAKGVTPKPRAPSFSPPPQTGGPSRPFEMAAGAKKGGKVGSASKRADGIAQKGKTRGTIVMCGGGMYKK